MQYPIPKMINYDVNNLKPWLHENCQRVEIGFINYHHNDALVNWVNTNEGGQEVNIGRLGWGERNTSWHVSYLGHQFRIRDVTDGTLLAEYVAQFHSINHIKEQSERRRERDGVEVSIRDTLSREWDRAHIVQRTFTEFGFNRGKLPKDLYGSMSTYYYNNRENRALEQFGSHAVIVNWYNNNI